MGRFIGAVALLVAIVSVTLFGQQPAKGVGFVRVRLWRSYPETLTIPHPKPYLDWCSDSSAGRLYRCPDDIEWRNGYVADCLLITSDGRVQREHGLWDSARRTNAKAFVGRLTAAELKRLEAVVNSSEFLALGSQPRQNKQARNSSIKPTKAEVLYVAVWRADGSGAYQQLVFPNSKARKPFDTALQPLLDWWNEMSRRTFAPASNAPPTNCSPTVQQKTTNIPSNGNERQR